MNKIEIKKKILGLFQIPLLRRFVSQWGQECTILYFHRVINDELISQENGPNRSLCVSFTFFESLIKYLNKEYTIISLDDFKTIPKRDPKSKFLCITFDDGYIDNYLNAYPILEFNKVPATFYITNDFIDRKGNIWWYEIWDLISSSSLLEFSFESKSYIFKIDNETSKYFAFQKIRSLIMTLKFSDITKLLEVITKKRIRNSYSHKFMTWREVIEIDNNSLFTIGCHTLSHPILRNENYSSAKYQINHSKNSIEKKLNHKIKHLAFPFGGKKEVSERDFKIAKELGFETAVTTYFSKKIEDPTFCLPRTAITDFYNLKEIDVRINGLSNFLGLQFG